jgi:hypothetical protein
MLILYYSKVQLGFLSEREEILYDKVYKKNEANKTEKDEK